VGYLDDEKGPIHKLVKQWKVALPLRAEDGTDPNVYYVPPLSPPRIDASGNVDLSKPRIPTEYLRSLFGPDVDRVLDTLKAEMAKAKAGEKSELLDTLIVYSWPKDIFPDLTKDPATLEWGGAETTKKA
jgi:nitrate reductase beta subunit